MASTIGIVSLSSGVIGEDFVKTRSGLGVSNVSRTWDSILPFCLIR